MAQGNTTVFIPCLTKDIKEIMIKHGVPEEFHALQLTRVLSELLVPKRFTTETELMKAL